MDWQDSLKLFLDNNPDLPQGDDRQQQSQPDQTPIRPILRIDIDRKRAGKVATIISGFNNDNIEAGNIAAMLKSRLACGGSARGGEILIQGDKGQLVHSLLTEAGYKVKR